MFEHFTSRLMSVLIRAYLQTMLEGVGEQHVAREEAQTGMELDHAVGSKSRY